MPKYTKLFVKPADDGKVYHRVIIAIIEEYGGRQIIGGRLDGYEFKCKNKTAARLAIKKAKERFKIKFWSLE